MKTTDIAIKSATAFFSSLVFLSSFWLLFKKVDFWDENGGMFDLLLPILINMSACTLLGWVNSRSLKHALLGSVAVLIMGIPIAYVFLSPLAEKVIKIIMPSTTFVSSGSFSGIWFLITPIILIELVTDSVFQSKRWLGLVIGTVLGLLILFGTEVITSNLGQSSTLSEIRLMFYAPISWVLIIITTNYNKVVI